MGSRKPTASRTTRQSRRSQARHCSALRQQQGHKEDEIALAHRFAHICLLNPPPVLRVTADTTHWLPGIKPLLPGIDAELLVIMHARYHEKSPCSEDTIRQLIGLPVPYHKGWEGDNRSSSMLVTGSLVVCHREVVVQILRVSTSFSRREKFRLHSSNISTWLCSRLPGEIGAQSLRSSMRARVE